MPLYTVLNHLTKEIRILHLEAGSPGNPLRCRLQTVSLLQRPIYEALSYVWGPRESDRMPEITVDGIAIRVTQNLVVALERLRLRDGPRTLWVDAICINQADVGEKATQVAMMNEVYSMTTRCLLWLGEEPEAPVPTVSREEAQEVERLLRESGDFLKNLAPQLLSGLDSSSPLVDEVKAWQEWTPSTEAAIQDSFRITRTTPCIWHGDDRDMSTLAQGDLASTRNDSVFHAFRLFRLLSQGLHLHEIPYLRLEPEGSYTYLTNARRAAHWLATRDWWTRVWTVQESVLPENCVIMYGPVEMPWQTLLDAIFNFHAHRMGCCAMLPGVNDMFNYHLDTVLELRGLRGRLIDGEDISLEELVRQFRYRDATDPRDKIYALLPLVTDWGSQAPLVPDYTKANTMREVYSDAVLKMIQVGGSLDALCQQSDTRDPSHNLLPSWVPNVSGPRPFGGSSDHFARQIALYNACAGRPASIRVVDPKILVLEGWRIDCIRRSSTHMLDLRQDGQTETIRYWHEVAQEECGSKNPEWKASFWRTVCGDSMVGGEKNAKFRRATEADERHFNDWCTANGLGEVFPIPVGGDSESGDGRDHPSAATPSLETGAMNHAIRVTSRQKRFVVSKSGRMGIAPKEVVLTFPRPDEVFVFPGGKAPFVLRPIGEREIPGLGTKPCHELLGDCYLHGVMDGEGLGGLKEKQTIYIV